MYDIPKLVKNYEALKRKTRNKLKSKTNYVLFNFTACYLTIMLPLGEPNIEILHNIILFQSQICYHFCFKRIYVHYEHQVQKAFLLVEI